jgi:hypothetical protein
MEYFDGLLALIEQRPKCAAQQGAPADGSNSPDKVDLSN